MVFKGTRDYSKKSKINLPPHGRGVYIFGEAADKGFIPMSADKKSITVFGGTGFLGRHIIWQLAKTGATIRVATRVKQRAGFLRPAGDVGQIIPLACDIHSDASVAAALDGATHAINLVGILAEKGKSTFERMHVEVAERIARAAQGEDLEMLVHVSALGASSDGLSRYARTKAAGESKIIHGFSRSVVLRPSVVFGPEDRFFNLFATLAQTGGCLPLIGGGKTRLQPVYVGDIAKAVLNIFSSSSPSKYFGNIYELGGPQVYTMREILELTQKFSKRPASLYNLPFAAATLVSLLPLVPLTRDQVNSLRQDSVVETNSPGFAALGIEPTGVEAVLPTYLRQYWPGGTFGEKTQAS